MDTGPGGLADLDELRPLMFSIAYRMTGSVGDAEDIAQEAAIRTYRAASSGRLVETPRAFVTTITTRLAIDHLRSARVRREAYVGTWLPEPLVTDPAPGPAERAEMSDSLSLARKRIDEGRPRFEASRREGEELTGRFLAAVSGGDMEQFIELLAPDVVMYGDGGGKAPAAATPVYGRERVARLLRGIFRQVQRQPVNVRAVQVNGQPGVLASHHDGTVLGVLTFDLADGQVQAIRSVINPDKLRHLA